MRYSIVNYLSVENHDSKTSEHIHNIFLYKTLKHASIEKPSSLLWLQCRKYYRITYHSGGEESLRWLCVFCFLFSWQWGGDKTSPDLFKCCKGNQIIIKFQSHLSSSAQTQMQT